MGMDIVQLSRGNFGDFRESKITKSGKSTKRLDQLAPNSVHVCLRIHLGMDIG